MYNSCRDIDNIIKINFINFVVIKTLCMFTSLTAKIQLKRLVKFQVLIAFLFEQFSLIKRKGFFQLAPRLCFYF